MRNLGQDGGSGDGIPQEIPQGIEKIHAPCVLVVDDERLVRWSIAETLGEMGYRVVEAGDARSALELFGDDVDLVLLDIHLPDCDDLSLLGRMVRMVPSTRVILMTAYATVATISEAAAYAVPVIPKPFDLAEVAACVRRALADRIY